MSRKYNSFFRYLYHFVHKSNNHMSFLSWFKLKCSVHCLLIIKASQIPTYTLRCPLINDVTARSTQKAPMSAFKKSCRYLISISAQYSSLERFSENFDEKAETYLIFFLRMHWFQKFTEPLPVDRQPQRPQKGLRDFFQKLHFLNQCIKLIKTSYSSAH